MIWLISVVVLLTCLSEGLCNRIKMPITSSGETLVMLPNTTYLLHQPKNLSQVSSQWLTVEG